MDERPYSDEAAPYIEEYGGKMGGLEYLRNNCPSLRNRILPSVIVKPGDKYNGELPQSESGEYIVRGSHPLDILGLVDVIPTEFPTKQEIFATVEQIRKESKSKMIMEYGQYENPGYDGKVVIGIQPRLRQFDKVKCVRRRGSIVDHPDNPGNYVISLVSDDATFSRSGLDIFAYKYFTGDGSVNNGFVRTHQEVADSGLISSGWSFQVEFMEREWGMKEDPYICQVRAFRKKTKNNKPSSLRNTNELVFGNTPDEGILLPVYYYGRYELSEYPYYNENGKLDYRDRVRSEYKWSVLDDNGPWALLKTCHSARTPLTFMPRRLHTYLACSQLGSGIASLEHHNFHLAQKAEVAVLEHTIPVKAMEKLLTMLSGPEYINPKVTCDLPEWNHVIKDVRVRIIAAGGRAKISIEE